MPRVGLDDQERGDHGGKEEPGETIRIQAKAGHLAITQDMIWLGADVALTASPAGKGGVRP
jgi:hypothetical protein